jgi:glycosyltransferase involved in cell wall biosynthesis
MRVLVNAVSGRRGGIFTYTRNLHAAFVNAGVDATIGLPYAGPGEEAGTSFEVNVDGFSPIRRLAWEQTVWRRIVHKRAPTVLFSSANFALLQSPVPQLLLMREGGLFNPVYLRHIMPTLGNKLRMENILRRQMMLRSIRAASAVMFPSETLFDWVRAYCPEIESRGVVNSYGIDLTRFTPQQPEPPQADGPLRLLYVSVYYPHKDPLTLLESVRSIRAMGIEATAHITMAESEFSPWPQGPGIYAQLSAAEQQGLLKLGPIQHEALNDTYHGNDIFIFPSMSETFGFPLVEAMASGLPVIASDTLTNREICGPAALYYPPFDAEALTARILQLRARPELYRQLSEDGVKRAHTRFNLNDHFSRLLGILQRISDMRGAAA